MQVTLSTGGNLQIITSSFKNLAPFSCGCGNVNGCPKSWWLDHFKKHVVLYCFPDISLTYNSQLLRGSTLSGAFSQALCKGPQVLTKRSK